MSVPDAVDTHQQLFRVLLAALSHPGRVCPVEIGGIRGAEGELSLAAARCLMDHEVTFAVAGPDSADLAARISRSCGAGRVGPQEADYVFVIGPSSNGLAARVGRGTLECPDTGATILYQLPLFSDGPAGAGARVPSVTLSGPGIRTVRSLAIPGLEPGELTLLGQVNHEYPLGVDAFFLFGNRAVMGLPRSTRIEVA